jgi:uncharacterized protein YbjQ (UPF0145 family)
MILSTTFEVPGKTVSENLGIVTGNTIRAKHLGKDIVAGLRQLVGGELKEYTEMLTEARAEALKRMKHNGKAVKADAIIGVRLTTSSIMGGSAEIVAYGTAVKLK